jgi:hypothetical protein
MAIAADMSIVRAREALRRLGGGRGGDDRFCLACGKPIGDEHPIRLHGDSFHAGCAVYRRPIEGRRARVVER